MYPKIGLLFRVFGHSLWEAGVLELLNIRVILVPELLITCIAHCRDIHYYRLLRSALWVQKMDEGALWG